MCCYALALVGCGGSAEHYSPLGDGDHDSAPLSPGVADATEHDHSAADRAGEGTLEVIAKSAVTSYLSRVHAVVTDAAGRVVAGADADADGSRADAAPDLQLKLREGSDYTLSLSASTTDAEPTTCRAVVGPLRVEADSVATVRVLAWDCGGPTGYVPSTIATECFWLAEWIYVSRASAELGEDIEVSAAGHDARGKLARFAWSAEKPSLGRFAEPQAARTSFRCQERGQAQPLTVSISDAECQAEVSHLVSCL